MSVLDKIDKPGDLRIIKKDLLPVLIKEIRDLMIRTCSSTGGHLGPSLGTVELTLALHYVFNAPEDKIIWDVGHQSYTHKIITGRRNKFGTLRQHGGISGFPNQKESEYDAFGTGHSSTAISAALGYAVARDLKKDRYKVIAVVGDGSMTGGLAYEGLNNAGAMGTDMIVILNDNAMFISHRVGALAAYLTRIMTLGLVKRLEKRVENFLKRLHFWGKTILRLAKRFRVILFPGMFFEEMGFTYLGPLDGHNMFRLIEVFNKIKEMKGPVLLHVITKKGKGYPPAEGRPIKFHGVPPFNPITGENDEDLKVPTYTGIFSKTLVELAREDDRIVAVTAAMPEGTGLDTFRAEFPKRFFDVGIAEGHAVTFSAGLASAGLRPVCAIYSSFLQRAVDQVIHDVCLQNLPVIFAIDRAGIVGEDGATHHGSFDISYLRMIPNLVIMAPKDEAEIQHMLKTALALNRPVALRYPRGAGIGVKLDSHLKNLPLGKSEILCQGDDILVLAVGNTVHPSLFAARQLLAEKIKVSVVNVRFIKPLDIELISDMIPGKRFVLTIEENVISGGLGSAVREAFPAVRVPIYSIGLPDVFVEHGGVEILREKYGFSAEKIIGKIRQLMKDEKK